MKEKWLQVDNIIGHEKTFPVPCEFCEEEMFLRYSEICLKKADNEKGYIPRYNAIEYKCSLCGNTVVFCVHDDREYLQGILDKRGGVPLYYPPKETWADESEMHRKKLESLGYL